MQETPMTMLVMYLHLLFKKRKKKSSPTFNLIVRISQFKCGDAFQPLLSILLCGFILHETCKFSFFTELYLPDVFWSGACRLSPDLLFYSFVQRSLVLIAQISSDEISVFLSTYRLLVS